jgi:ATP-dependent helicase HrpA
MQVNEGNHAIERDGITQWDFGELPRELTFERAGLSMAGYPALVDQQDSVAIRLFDTFEAADSSMRVGVKRLLCLALREQVKQLEKRLPINQQAVLLLSGLIERDKLHADMLAAILDRAFLGDDTLPRTQSEFIAQTGKARSRLGIIVNTYAELIEAIAKAYQTFKQLMASMGKLDRGLEESLQEQLQHLIYPGFLSDTHWQYLQHYPRYLKGMTLRLEKFCKNPARYSQQMEAVARLWQQYLQRLQKHSQKGISDPNLEIFRWQMEELRISLFAQELKTPAPVSVKRLEKLWEKVHE